jgi:hypothetical protein
MSSQRAAGRPTSPAHAVRRRRDAALERTRSITKTVAVTSVAAVAAFGIYISRAVPGHAASTSGSAGSTASPSGAVSTGNGASGGQSPSNLAPPNSPPVQSQQQAPVVSGSS